MSLFGKITSKGQTTVPLAIRNKLGVKSGDHLEYVIGDDGQIMLRKAPGLESLRGIVTPPVAIDPDEIDRVIAMLRGRG
jgi:AbrB family looped-hinge helix DNA binding protein